MAFYPLSEFPPGHRLAYERDGSAIYKYNANDAPTHPSPSIWWRMNDESNATQIADFYRLAVVFPVAVHLIGIYFTRPTTVNWPRFVEVSSDTTNGLDGAWTQILDDNSAEKNILSTFRSFIEQVDLPNINAVRFISNQVSNINFSQITALHLYVASQETFLKVWDPVLDQEIDPEDFDWGVLYAGEVHDRQFRIKNVRSLTAHDIEVTNLSYTNTSIDTAYDFSIDGGAFQRPLDIGDLGPGAISDVITQRLTLPENQIVTSYATQISAIPDSWSG